MTTKEQREIIEAYERGEEIEYGLPNYEWCTLLSKEEYIKVFGCECQFNFSYYEYRIKPWRAKEGCDYYYIASNGEVYSVAERSDSHDDRHYSIGNYFRTKEDAEKASELLVKTLTKFHNND